MSEDQAKTTIRKLVEKYEAVKAAGTINKYTEEETKRGFVEPLFEALGWEVGNRGEVTLEEQISGDRVDYGFYLNGRIKFYLEAKPFKADIHKEAYAQQAIRYSWNKGVTWAVLTDFESLVVFNAMSSEKTLGGKRFFEIPYTEYLDRFNQLWLLSKEAFETDLIDIEAQRVGKKLQKVSVGEQLYKDFNECRRQLTSSFKVSNDNLDQHLLDEGVQKLLNRLIFIRVAEDRKVEPATLIPLIRQWEAGGRKGTPFAAMVQKFRELDRIYNSSIFRPHPLEKWDELDGATQKVIDILYGKKGYVDYDFSVIPADVLGSVYENYLGYKLQESQGKKRSAGAYLELSKDSQKRKEHGIYYTPTYIVDYIVRRTLGPVLDRCRSVKDLAKIKVLDPACGSGSFLIKAMELIASKYEELGTKKIDVKGKVNILLQNIYGMDLDEQATEIARLNLLLNTFDAKTKLPNLDSNIKTGNSLISGKRGELVKYFGKNYRLRKPLNWEEEFPEVFAQGGFDCIIGNPPYGADLSEEEKRFFSDVYGMSSTDTAVLFIKKCYDNLNPKGVMGLIVPKAFSFASNYSKVREYLWNGISLVADCGKAWKTVKLEQLVFVATKEARLDLYASTVLKNEHFIDIGEIDKKVSKKFGFLLNGVSKGEIKIAEKILDNTAMLSEISSNQRGAMLQKEIGNAGDLEVIGGANIGREGIKGVKGKIDKDKINDQKAYVQPNSVLVQNIVAHIENPTDHIKITATVPEKPKYVILDTINQLILDRSYSPYLICALLNSNLMNWFVYRFIFGKAIRTMHFDRVVTERIPIPPVTNDTKVSEFSKNVSELYTKMQHNEENSNDWQHLKYEIEKIENKINVEIYKLYGLNEQDSKIVEGSLISNDKRS